MMKYKGYTATVEYDEEDGVFIGEVVGILDVITFEADRPEDLEKEFHVSVDVYLEYCDEKGVPPELPREERRRAVS
jgi:predicted HicB family RNase H-like nuclease